MAHASVYTEYGVVSATPWPNPHAYIYMISAKPIWEGTLAYLG